MTRATSGIWLCFGVGIGNFGAGRELTTAILVEAVEDELGDAGAVIASYGSTGNIAVRTRLSGNRLRRALHDATGRRWAVVDLRDLQRALGTLSKWPEPRSSDDVRWTPGLAFLVEGAHAGRLRATPRGVFRPVGGGIVALYKNDLLVRGTQRLDSAHRQGGWGGISGDVARAGDTWTARSVRPINGIIRRVGHEVTEPSG